MFGFVRALLDTFLTRLLPLPPPTSKPASEEVLIERHGDTLRLRCSQRSRDYSRINSLFFLDRKTITVTTFKPGYLRRGYKIERYRYSFEAIKYIGLEVWVSGEVPAPASWVIVLRPVDGGYQYLTFLTEDYFGCDAALTCICEATGIRRSDLNFPLSHKS